MYMEVLTDPTEEKSTCSNMVCNINGTGKAATLGIR